MYKKFLTLIFVVVLFSCVNDDVAIKSIEAERLNNILSDISSDYILFGHQDDLAYGIGWKGMINESDVKRTTGDYPALFGWELGNIGESENLDGVPFDSIKTYIKRVHKMGGVNTISWHARYPVTDADSWTLDHISVEDILPGGDHHNLFIKRMDLLANFIADLKDNNQVPIPVIFRPWHEMMGGWFWWGSQTISHQQYIELFQFTVHYLKVERKLRNLLIAYSPDGTVKTADEYMTRYPGDDYVDILGIDNYGDFTRNRLDNIVQQLTFVVDLATERNKIPAFTETGSDRLVVPKWYTVNLLQVLKASEKTRKLAYVMVWRNRDTAHFYVPYPEHAEADDFRKFTDEEMLLLLTDYKTLIE